MERFQPLIGLVLIAAIAVAWSSNRQAIRLRTVAWGFGLQVLFAVIVLKTGVGQATFQALGDRIRQLLEFSAVGSALVFGPLGDRAVWGE
ncbi:MAG: Na+ dependent nucleoside transporter N-terminal domain-containing protein, partial [Vicinamibacterales bacterium]